MEPQEVKDQDKEKTHKKLHVTVFSPRTPKGKKFVWEPTLIVGEAAKEAAAKFRYAEGTPGLSKEGQVLPNDQTLEAAGVMDGDELTLVDVGGGV